MAKFSAAVFPLALSPAAASSLDFADGGMWSFEDEYRARVRRYPSRWHDGQASARDGGGKDVVGDTRESRTRFAARTQRTHDPFRRTRERKIRRQGTPIHVEQFASFFKPIFLDRPGV